MASPRSVVSEGYTKYGTSAPFRYRQAIRLERSETDVKPASEAVKLPGTALVSVGHKACGWQSYGLGTESWPRKGARGNARYKEETDHNKVSINLHPTPSATLALIAVYSAQSQPASAQIDTRTPSKPHSPHNKPVVVVQHAGHNVACPNPNVLALSQRSNCHS